MSSDAASELIARSARALRLEIPRFTSWLGDHLEHPQPGSPARSDTDALASGRNAGRAKRWILSESLRQTGRITGNVTDHVVALGKCLAVDPAPVYSPMTLGRVALDGAVWVCYVLDRGQALETRLLRGAALLLDSAREEAIAVADLPESFALPGAADIVKQILANVQGWIEAAGIEIRLDRGRPTGLAWEPGAKAVPVKLNATREAARYFAEIPVAHRMGSGVAHSTPWMLHDQDDRPSSVFMAASMTITSLLCMSKIAETYGRYYGHDTDADNARRERHGQLITKLMTDLSAAGFSSVGRYAGEPRLQQPPRPRKPVRLDGQPKPGSSAATGR